MISPISNTAPPQVAAQPKAAPQQAPSAKPQPPVTDTVQLSAAKAIQQEAVESPSQTAHEASTGDSQARRLLAREAAVAAESK